MSREKFYDKHELLEFLRYLDSKLDRQLDLVAVGGSALNLLGVKRKTKDIDLMVLGQDDEYVLDLLDIVKDRYKERDVDFFFNYKMILTKDGTTFYQKLPEDCCETDLGFDPCFSKIRLKIMNPLDVLVSKINRYSLDDAIDIMVIIKHYGFSRDQISQRFKEYYDGYEGSKHNMKQNFKYAMETIYGE